MRISTAQIFAKNTQNLNDTSNNLFKLQQQLSTGKKILQPSDDPLASAQILKLTKEVEKTEQYQSNIEVSERRLSLEEVTLDQLNNSFNRIKELSIQANSGAVSDTDRRMIAVELEGIENEMFALMNTKDSQGEYLFSGFKGFDASYSYDGATDRYIYNGDEGRRSIQIGPDHQLPSTDSGFEIFEKVPSVLTLDALAGAEFSDATIVNYEEFQQFTDNLGPASIAFDTVAGTYSVTDRNNQPVFSGNPAAALTGVPYTPASGDVIEFAGVQLKIDTPVTGSVDINTHRERDNILNVTHQLVADLRSISTEGDPDGNAKLQGAIARALTSLEGIQDKNIETRGTIGSRLNTLEHQQEVNEDILLYTKEARSSFQDLDYNEAISDFTLQQTTLNAAYASFSQIQSLSLFNFIK